MKRTIKVLVFVLSLVLLLQSFAACGSKKSGQETGEVTTEPVTEAGPTVEELVGFGKSDHNFKTFTILVSDTDQSEHLAEGYDGTIVNDLIFARNMQAEDYFGIEIKVHPEQGGQPAHKQNFMSKIQTAALTEENPYDLIVGVTSMVSSMFGNSYFLPTNHLDYVDLSRNWWMTDLHEQLQINGNIYLLYGDMNLSLYSKVHCFMFGEQLVRDLQIEDPYDLVENNEWTIEKVIEMSATAGAELNGNETPEIGSDRLGLIGTVNPQRAFMTAFGLELIAHDQETGVPAFPEALPERFTNLYSKISNAYRDNDYNIFLPAEDNDYSPAFYAMSANRVLFLPAYMGWITDEIIRNMSSDYGIVPYPKADGEQIGYYSQLATGATCTLFPKNVADVDLSAQVATYMSYLGNRDVSKKYFQNYLQERLSKSPRMAEMLGLIRETTTMSLTTVYSSSFGKALMELFEVSYVHDYGDGLSSEYASRLKTYKFELKQIIKNYEVAEEET